jgi:hypothetical protein
MPYKALFIMILLVSFSCNNDAGTIPGKNTYYDPGYNPYSHIKNIPLPDGFRRMDSAGTSFAGFLRDIELKRDRTVYLFNGERKANQFAQYAVMDISVGNKDLQQCADAVMRLRAEFLYAQKDFEKIFFYDNAKTVYRFSEPYSRTHFNSYLNRVFGMCGSASLAKQLAIVTDLHEIRPGDVLIKGGFPGHASIVMDVAVNDAGKKIYLLAQSYMPAQDIHVLNNPSDKILSPWYEVDEKTFIITPEYIFKRSELKRW